MPSPLPYLKLFQKEWLASSGTRKLSLAGRGLYIDLLAYQWEDGFIPDDIEEIAAMVGVPRAEVAKVWPKVRGQFEEIVPGKLANRRVMEDREATLQKVESLKANGSRGGTAKRENGNDPDNQLPTKRLANANQKLGKSSSKSSSKTVAKPEPDNILIPPNPLLGGNCVLDWLPPEMRSERLERAWSEFERHRRELKVKPYTGPGIERLRSMVLELKMPPDRFAEVVEHCVSRQWRGIPAEVLSGWETGHPSPSHASVSGKADMDPDMVRRLVG